MNDFTVIYEDNHIIVIEKPHGVLSQKDHTGEEDISDRIKEYIKIKYQKPGEVYLGHIHRLDRNAGGLMIFARTSKAASRLSLQFREKTTTKEYIIVVEGKFPQQSGIMQDKIIKNEEKRIAQSSPSGKEAVLKFAIVSTFNKQNKVFTMLHVILETGRFHQIRFQFAKRGFPVAGDAKYGSTIKLPQGRIALYSKKIEVIHPTKKETITFEKDPEQGWPFA